jgi:biotin carboxyl carrier protein
MTYAPPAREQGASGDGVLRALMSGLVRAVNAAPGDAVEAGSPLVVIEAMKLEHAHSLNSGGVVGQVLVRPGEQVASGQVLLRLN